MRLIRKINRGYLVHVTHVIHFMAVGSPKIRLQDLYYWSGKIVRETTTHGLIELVARMESVYRTTIFHKCMPSYTH